MKTRMLTRGQLDEASRILHEGGLVAFPTETVYGLGADALNPQAVLKIFAAKNRPADNPLIVHVSSPEEVPPLVKRIIPKARILMEKFWPGPLSIVFEKSAAVPDEVTAGLDTVVIRMPSNRIANQLIRMARIPIAAPSANSSGKPSPTKAEHVMEDLMGRIDAVIDGGSCSKGLESTVIDVRGRTPIILRLGSVPIEDIEKAVGKVKIASVTDKVRSPGMKYRHYAPKIELILVEGKSESVHRRIAEIKAGLPGKKVAVLAGHELTAHSLYERLRHTEADVLVAAGIEEVGLGRAIMDRLRRAASRIEKV